MTREGFSDFIYAIEHSSSLRRKEKQCSENINFIDLAKRYGFQVTIKDLEEDRRLRSIET